MRAALASTGFACLLAIVPIANEAIAQDTGSLIRPAPAQMGVDARSSSAATRRIMYAFAECVIKSNRNRAEAYREAFPGSREALEIAKRIVSADCIDYGSLTFREPLLRSAVYEGLYRSRFARSSVDDLSTIPALDYAQGGDLSNDSDRQAIALRQYADCVVRADPVNAHALMESLAGTGRENNAFSALSPKLSGCLPAGQTLTFTRIQLRGVIGEVLFRLRTHTPQSQG